MRDLFALLNPLLPSLRSVGLEEAAARLERAMENIYQPSDLLGDVRRELWSLLHSNTLPPAQKWEVEAASALADALEDRR